MWNLLLNHNRKRRNVCRGRGSVDVYRTWDLQIEKCADSPNSCNQDMETSGESGPQYILLSFLDAYYTIKLDSNNLLLGFLHVYTYKCQIQMARPRVRMKLYLWKVKEGACRDLRCMWVKWKEREIKGACFVWNIIVNTNIRASTRHMTEMLGPLYL